MKINMATHGEEKINRRDFQSFLERHKLTPEDDDEPFILDYKTESTKGKPNAQKLTEDKFDFVCVLSTKRLLRNAFNMPIFHADSTYKLNWMGFPIHLFGVTDHRRSFHLVAIGFSTQETQKQFSFCFKVIKSGIKDIFNVNIDFKAFMSDSAGALKGAFKEHFPRALQRVCWFHVKKAVDKQTFKSCSSKDQFMNDLDKLHLCSSTQVFDIASELFAIKWAAEEKGIMAYFQKWWFKPTHKHWYAGAMPFTPCTNNAVESANRRLKDDFDLRTRSKINVFKTKIIKVVEDHSIEYRDGVKEIKKEAQISDRLWNNGLTWAKSAKKVEIQKNTDHTCYFLPAGDLLVVNKDYLAKYKESKWCNFTEFASNSSSIWAVKIPLQDVISSTCTCPCFLKEYICKHIIGMGIRLRTLNVPDYILKVENRRIKRGRPAHALPALQHQ